MANPYSFEADDLRRRARLEFGMAARSGHAQAIITSANLASKQEIREDIDRLAPNERALLYEHVSVEEILSE